MGYNFINNRSCLLFVVLLINYSIDVAFVMKDVILRLKISWCAFAVKLLLQHYQSKISKCTSFNKDAANVGPNIQLYSLCRNYSLDCLVLKIFNWSVPKRTNFFKCICRLEKYKAKWPKIVSKNERKYSC